MRFLVWILSIAAVHAQVTIVGSASVTGQTAVSASGGTTPALVRETNQSLLPNASTCGGSLCTISPSGTFTLHLADPANSGNTLVMALSAAPAGGGCAVVGGDITDDASNTWTLDASNGANANNQYTFVLHTANIAANTTTVTFHNVHCGTSNTHSLHIKVSEFTNVTATSPVDGTPVCSAGSGTAVTAGSITTTVAGDLVWSYVIRTNTQPNKTAGFTAGVAGSGFTLSTADRLDGNATEYQVQASAGALNSDFTMADTATWQACAIAFKAGSSGSGIPSGVHVVGIWHETWVQGNSTTQTLQIPCRGNLLVLASGGNYHWGITSVTDSGSNTWQNTGAQINNQNIASEGAQTWYVFGSSVCSSTYTVTITWNSTSSGHGGTLFYDIANANSSPFDVDATSTTGGSCCTQNDPGGAALTGKPLITPGVANTVMICTLPVEYNTVGGVSNVTGILLDSSTYSGENQSGPEPVDQNNGWAHANLSGTSQQSVTWTQFYPGASFSFRGNVARCNTWK